jgi:vesicle coat complex subunit
VNISNKHAEHKNSYKQIGKVQELKSELIAAKKDKPNKRLGILKKILANSTMGNDMSPLYPDVLECLSDKESLEMKKMIWLFVVFYARKNSELTKRCVTFLAQASVIFIKIL